MNLKVFTPPILIQKIFSGSIWSSSVNKILFTFDDGPNPGTTELILKKLSEQKIKAAFFCVGNNISQYSELTKMILQEGHLIANHTYNHKRLPDISFRDSIYEVKTFNDVMTEKYGIEVRYFRPPHGRLALKLHRLMKQFKMKNVMWTLLTYDFTGDFSIVKDAVDSSLNANSNIVLHDSIKSGKIITDSISYILDKADENGYRIGEPSECLN